MQEKISVIVPIYKTEKYLKKCIDSIINQSYTNIEIILVNDGSPDNCLEICKEYALQDSRIHIVDKPNGGLSDARNAGIKQATGDFITFVDSDDFLYPEACSKLAEAQKRTDADIVYMGSISINADYTEGVRKKRVDEGILDLDNINYLKQMCLRQQDCSVWGGMYKRWIFDKYQFAAGKLNEDYLFLTEVCLKEILKITLIDYCGYGYYMRENSISRQGLGKSSIDAVYNGIELKQMTAQCNTWAVPYISAYVAYQARTAMLIMPLKLKKRYKEFIKVCRKTLKENFDFFKEYYPNKKDIYFVRLFMACPNVALVIAKFLRGKD